MTAKTDTLYTRLLAITAEAGRIEATGKNFAGGRAISIENVEDALRGPLVNHGVSIRFRLVSLEGQDKAWQAHVCAVVTHADDPTQQFEDEWADTGPNPAAAYSYARKSYLKALFHLAAAEDEGGAAVQASTKPARAASNAPAARNGATGDLCQQCKAEGLVNKKNYPAKFWPGSRSCDGIEVDGSYANHPAPVPVGVSENGPLFSTDV